MHICQWDAHTVLGETVACEAMLEIEMRVPTFKESLEEEAGCVGGEDGGTDVHGPPLPGHDNYADEEEHDADLNANGSDKVE